MNTKLEVRYRREPGMGLMNRQAFAKRMGYLRSLAPELGELVRSSSIDLNQVRNNIESFIGTVEIPLGLVGPLLFDSGAGEPESVHTAVATTEGALVASMNRGAKALSECGGFRAHVVQQRMLRAPVFWFRTLTESVRFERWVQENFPRIAEVTRRHSNHARLVEISPVLCGRIIHLKFVYTTGDAAGQNMVTTCTWHACLWIREQFTRETSVEMLRFAVEGNGSSDKKASFASLQRGRGTHVVGECLLTHEVIERTLRTTAEDMVRLYESSMLPSRLDGMVSYNFNVANVLAGVFASTGQDLACVHEAALSVINLERSPRGLYMSLSLPCLVIGTVGGGTHLPAQSRVLELMGCKGKGKVERFARLIAGFCLALEASTLAAVASGQFARAHQQLGRNKPVNWLVRAELDREFLNAGMQHLPAPIREVRFAAEAAIDNGILTDLTSRISRKLIGFVPAQLFLADGSVRELLIKSKALDHEVYDGLHFMASNLSVDLADAILEFKESLEYRGCHLKELQLYTALHAAGCPHLPEFYGARLDPAREIYLLFIERLQPGEMLLFNSEQQPERWNDERLEAVLRAIHAVHRRFADEAERARVPAVQRFDLRAGLGLYRKFVHMNRRDHAYLEADELFPRLLARWQEEAPTFTSARTVIHNDFNPRNVALRASGQPCIYDWELAVLDVPQRDVFEMLAFTLPPGGDPRRLRGLLRLHHALTREINGEGYTWRSYLEDFVSAGEVFLLSRLTFYIAGSGLADYPFTERVYRSSRELLRLAEGWSRD